MSIFITKSGILTTVQDLGRNGFRRFGINQNGAMDKTAVRLVNSLLANPENTPVLEMHFPAAEITFEKPAFFAIGGADFSAHLDNSPVRNWLIHHAREGSVLKFNEKRAGNRVYLAIKGGFEIENWLGSTSTNLKAKTGGFRGRKLQHGDRLRFSHNAAPIPKIKRVGITNSLIPVYSRFPTVRVVAGAEFELLTAVSQIDFGKRAYSISPHSDRMGFRLQGEPLDLREDKEMVSSAVSFGTIQLLPDGQMIVLMADHQTSGGYPRIANVIPTDLPLLAQLGAHEKTGFQMISLEDAENLLLEFEQGLNLLKIAAGFL